jgi:hypothetical protein
MNRRRPLTLLPVAMLLAGMALPAAADSFRCGSRLVVEGDSAGKLRTLCGEPAEITVTNVLRPAWVWVGGRRFRVGQDPVVVPVETWTYNLGSLRLLRRIRIEDGLVTRIDTLGYGYP